MLTFFFVCFTYPWVPDFLSLSLFLSYSPLGHRVNKSSITCFVQGQKQGVSCQQRSILVHCTKDRSTRGTRNKLIFYVTQASSNWRCKDSNWRFKGKLSVLGKRLLMFDAGLHTCWESTLLLSYISIPELSIFILRLHEAKTATWKDKGQDQCELMLIGRWRDPARPPSAASWPFLAAIPPPRYGAGRPLPRMGISGPTI